MKRTTISLPHDLAQDVEREAQRRRVSISTVTRDALREHIQRQATSRLPFIGIGRSGRHDTARRAEEILAREWGDDARGR
jgi:Arc/MetJ-type ribon-helix-helix transcriptional regulator